MFSTYPMQASQVVTRSFAPGLLVDMAESNQRVVSFDINNGWSNDGGSWGRPIPTNTMLAPLLVQAAPLTVAEGVSRFSS
jgi:hypothetical protein